MTANLPWSTKLRSEVANRWNELIQLRRDFHRYPEVSLQEYKTAQRVKDWLISQGVNSVQSKAGTGVVALIQGGHPGPTVLYRADIDGLPISEASGVEFASENEGVMHSCGHDGHIAVALMLAAILNRDRQNLSGNLKVLFQPAEETGQGAKAMIDEGVMEDPKVDFALGLHVVGQAPVGVLGITPGPMLAGTIDFNITVQGKGGHAAYPQETVDPIVVGAQVVTALQTVVSRNINPRQPAVVTVGTFHGGTKENIIPETAEMTGTIRAYGMELLHEIMGRVEVLSRGVTEALGASAAVTHRLKAPPLVNDADFSQRVHRHATELVGDRAVVENQVMADDDMARYLEKATGCYFFLGGADPAKGPKGHHQPEFSFDDRGLALGLELSLRVIEDCLSP